MEVAYWAVPKQGLGTHYDPQEFVNYNLASFDPTLYNVLDPQFTTVSDNIENIKVDPYHLQSSISIYGHTLDADEFVLQHAFYLYTPVSGLYSVSSRGADNYLAVWTGSAAVSGYNNQNALFIISDAGSGNPAPFQAQGGTYTPVRIIFGSGGAPNYFSVQITGPNGETVLASRDPYNAVNPYIVTNTCDGANPPIQLGPAGA